MIHRFKAWDGQTLHDCNFNVLTINPNHPDGPLVLMEKTRGGERVPVTLAPYIGLNDNVDSPLFIGAVCEFTYNGDATASFYNSNVGKLFKDGVADAVMVRIDPREADMLGFMATTYFKKDGQLLDHKRMEIATTDMTEDTPLTDTEAKEMAAPYFERDRVGMFLRYLISKGGVHLVGNVYEHPDLLPEPT